MSDKEFLIKYEELLDKGYCDCNEMNCIDNNSPRRILNIAKKLQQENQQLKEKIEKINNYLDKNYTMENQFWFDHIQDIVKDR